MEYSIEGHQWSLGRRTSGEGIRDGWREFYDLGFKRGREGIKEGGQHLDFQFSSPLPGSRNPFFFFFFLLYDHNETSRGKGLF